MAAMLCFLLELAPNLTSQMVRMGAASRLISVRLVSLAWTNVKEFSGHQCKKVWGQRTAIVVVISCFTAVCPVNPELLSTFHVFSLSLSGSFLFMILMSLLCI